MFVLGLDYLFLLLSVPMYCLLFPYLLISDAVTFSIQSFIGLEGERERMSVIVELGVMTMGGVGSIDGCGSVLLCLHCSVWLLSETRCSCWRHPVSKKSQRTSNWGRTRCRSVDGGASCCVDSLSLHMGQVSDPMSHCQIHSVQKTRSQQGASTAWSTTSLQIGH